MFKILKSFKKFNELNHQSPASSGGVNSPGYGQGAHVGNWGVNYGNTSKSVRNNFGEKGDGDPNIMPKPNGSLKFPSVLFDPVNGKMLHEDEINQLHQDYQIKCKQNSEEAIIFDKLTSNSIEFMINYINDHS